MARKNSFELKRQLLEAFKEVDPNDEASLATLFLRHFSDLTFNIRPEVNEAHKLEISQLVDQHVRRGTARTYNCLAMHLLLTRLYELVDL